MFNEDNKNSEIFYYTNNTIAKRCSEPGFLLVTMQNC